MKTIELITGSNTKKRTIIFVEQIKYIREKTQNQVYIKFNNENSLVANISLNEITKLIKEL